MIRFCCLLWIGVVEFFIWYLCFKWLVILVFSVMVMICFFFKVILIGFGNGWFVVVLDIIIILLIGNLIVEFLCYFVSCWVIGLMKVIFLFLFVVMIVFVIELRIIFRYWCFFLIWCWVLIIVCFWSFNCRWLLICVWYNVKLNGLVMKLIFFILRVFCLVL